ncbi:uncharacterized protein [Nicotiana sylvestris]|uniref:uncharacterized protein n=1 Tax=Nicotiana sylvestris TaxID=4096 RepID=UPI00388C9548
MSASPGNWEGQSTTRTLLFNGQYYSWWKNRMRDHIIGEDYELWDIVTDGLLATLKKNVEGVDMSTAESKVVPLLSKFGTHCIWLMKEHLRIILEEDRVEKILTRVSPITWESKVTAIQESKNISTLLLDELTENLTAYGLRRQTMKMDVPKKERSLALRITEDSDLEDDEMAMITKDCKNYLRRGNDSSRSGSYSKSKAPEKQTNDGCYKCRKTDHHIKNCPLWEIKWKKERAERRNRKKEQVHALDSTVLKHRSANLKLKLGTGKKTVDQTQLTFEENIGKMKDELYKRDEQLRIPKEDLRKVQVKGSSQIWYMNIGCSKHMTGSKNLFLSLEDLKGGNVTFENWKKGEIIGVGKVCKIYSHSIENVYLIDGLKYSLISISQLCDRG